jgi:hypothetical protein
MRLNEIYLDTSRKRKNKNIKDKSKFNNNVDLSNKQVLTFMLMLE